MNADRCDLAERYGVPVKTAAEWASKRTGSPYAKFGKYARYRLSDVIAWGESDSTIITARSLTMAGRPALRIGAARQVVREYLGGGVWLARCLYRDSDGVTRRVQRLGPPDEHDKHGKLAEGALIEALAERRPPSEPEATSLQTLVMSLVDRHLERLADDGRSIKTLDTYRYDAGRLAKFIGGVRIGEAPRPGWTLRCGRCERPTAPQWTAAPAHSFVAPSSSQC
jgi:hypothetical protein